MQPKQALTFQSKALGDDALIVTRLVGEERLSTSFRFELELIGLPDAAGGLDPEQVLYEPARVGIKQPLELAGGGVGSRVRWFDGVLVEFEQLEQRQGWVAYRAVLAPMVGLLEDFHRSRVFLDKTIDGLVGEVLQGELGLSTGQDFEFKLSRKPDEPDPDDDPGQRAVYPQREYVVQFEETDRDFLQRWLAHEGVFYFFNNDGTQEKVLFGDSIGAYEPVDAAHKTFPYRPAEDASSSGGDTVEEVRQFVATYRRLPEQVALRDYNWRTPSATLTTSAQVRDGGVGVQHEYNDHYKTVAQGQALAQVRAEERVWEGRTMRGTSTCRSFRPGKTFELSEHFTARLNGDYVLIAVRHEAEQAVNLNASTVTGANYRNTFEAIPAEVVFRPPHDVEWPAIRGVIHAKVDAEGEGDYAELDEQGRYKLTIPFDDHLDDATPGQATRWVRMAQPYAGMDSGFHFPLLKGVEVLVTHIDGDPDRPIIASAVPNAETVSPTNSSNQSQNRVQTTQGNMFLMDDDADGTGFVFVDGGGRTVHDTRQPLRGKGTGGAGVGYGGVEGDDPPESPVPRSSGRPASDAGARSPRAGAGRAGFGGLQPSGGPTPLPFPQRVPRAGQGAETLNDLTFPGIPEDPSTAAKEAAPAKATEQQGDAAAVQDSVEQATLKAADADNTSSYNVLKWWAYNAAKNNGLADSEYYDEGDAALAKMQTLGPQPLPADLSYTLKADEWSPAWALTYKIGDSLSFARGKSYKFSNVPVSYAFSKTSTNYKQVDGDTYTESHVNGKVHTRSWVAGDVVNEKWWHGQKASATWHLGAIADSVMVLNAKASFALTSGVKTANTINLGVFNDNSLTLGHKYSVGAQLGETGELKLFAGGKVSLALTGATQMHLSFSGGAHVKVEGAWPAVQKVTLPKSVDTTMDEVKMALRSQHLVLNQTVTALKRTNNALKQTALGLSYEKLCLKKDDTALSKKTTALDKQMQVLNDRAVALVKDNKALNYAQKGLVDSKTAGVHIWQ